MLVKKIKIYLQIFFFPPFFFLFFFRFLVGLINQSTFFRTSASVNCGYKWAWVLTNHYIVRSLLYIYTHTYFGISISRYVGYNGIYIYIYRARYIAILLSWTERPSLVTQVRSLPTVLAFKDGKVVNQFVGALPEPHVKKCVPVPTFFRFFVFSFFVLYSSYFYFLVLL